LNWFDWIFVSFWGRIASYVTEKSGKKTSNQTKSNRNEIKQIGSELKNRIYRTYLKSLIRFYW